GGFVVDVDESVARWVGDSMPRWAEWMARPFSWLGGALGLGVVTLLGAVALGRRGRRRDAALLTLAYAGSQLSMSLVKALTDRPRPTFDPAIALPSSTSFPSGHAVGAVAVLCLAALLLAPGGRRTRLLALAAVLALGVGASRVVLGVHWTSDVVAGWAFGLAWVAACVLLRPRR
ncbi:MAG TPA: phosphatase PAP2 family protein, partial [Gaiellaceae bacterium]|nr:phosphatase PAP2 family protein [Gaiellaceae bacterium]